MMADIQSGGSVLLGADVESLFDAMQEGIVVRDGAGEVIACNRMARALLGLPPGGFRDPPVSPASGNYLRADGSPLPPDEHPAQLTLCSGEPQRGVVLGVRREGMPVAWIRLNCEPLRGSQGVMQGVMTSFADITPMMETQAALRASEARNRTLAEAIVQSGCSVIITDRAGRIEYVNPACCRAYGYTAEELLGADPSIFKSGETSDEEYANLWQTIIAGEVWRGELSNRSRDGRLIREAVSISPVRDETGGVRHFVALKEDITQLRDDERRRHELFERVARLERMELVATLASGIAHDFNNVLVAILGYSELAAAQLKLDGRLPRVEGYVEEIRIAGNRARGLIQQLLDFSRGGALQPRLTRIDELVHEAVGLLRATLPDSIAVTCEIQADLPALSVEPGHLNQVLMNLLINARDALHGHGAIRVAARRQTVDEALMCESCRREFSGEFVLLEIGDDGAGIAPEHRSRLFEPFFTTKDVGRGTGMGLPVVHGVTHQYDGHVRMQSNPGAGTTMQIFLPASLFGAIGADGLRAA